MEKKVGEEEGKNFNDEYTTAQRCTPQKKFNSYSFRGYARTKQAKIDFGVVCHIPLTLLSTALTFSLQNPFFFCFRFFLVLNNKTHT